MPNGTSAPRHSGTAFADLRMLSPEEHERVVHWFYDRS
jgi:hypothetical protein